MTHYSRLALCALAVLGTACASSSFNATWKNPDATPVALGGKKVLAVVQVAEQARRRSAEDALAAEITKRGALGIASYTLFPSSAAQQDTAAAKALAKQEGIAGVVVMQFTGKEQSQSTVLNTSPGYIYDPFYRRPWGYWGRGWGTVYVSETVQTNTRVLVETRVYSLEQERLLWAGTSETLNPSSSDAVVRDLSSAVAKQLTKAGVLAK